MRAAAYLSLVFAAALAPGQPGDCTLEPSDGRRQASLPNGVTATMSWSACTSVVKDIVFEWPYEPGFPGAARGLLERAATLVRDWERVTALVVSPFGDFAEALERRAGTQRAYVPGEALPVTDNGVPGWDGASVVFSSTDRTTRMTVHYWANP